ncbi:MAG TPA: MBL fold metallo-hydrolase, partial [Bacteroidota bacterium]
MSLSLQVFGSSSSGNCTAVWNRHGAVLVDCGFAPRYIVRHLHAVGLPSTAVHTVLITHTHSDHVHDGALRMFVEAGATIVCTPSVRASLISRFPGARTAERRGLIYETGDARAITGGFSVRAFAVPHDSDGGCSGFRITDDTGPKARSVVIATDLGFAREGLHDEFRDADVVVVESPHDIAMLEHSGRPLFLINRIRRIGHLSNEQSSRFLGEVVERSARPPQ